MLGNNALKAVALAGLAMTAGLVLPAPEASARVVVGIGVGVPYVGPAPWYYGPPAYYVPPPVVYAPPPVIVQPPPVAPAYVAPQPQSWYYCDNPKGYYPYVQNCNNAWRPVPARPH